MQNITKLCRVHAIDKNNGNKYFQLFYVDKRWDNTNYGKIIADYKAMGLSAKKHAEEIVNEMFTAEEIEFLKVYFEQEEGMELFVQEYPLPLTRRQLHDRNELFIEANTFKYLAQQDSSSIVYTKNNGLPFKVAGIRAYSL